MRVPLFIGAAVLAATCLVVASESSTNASESPARADVPVVEGGVVRYSAAFAERAGIALEPATSAEVVPSIRVTGNVTYDPAHVAVVGSRLGGLARRIERFEGDLVKQGDLLAELESSGLAEAQASIAVTGAQQRAAERNARRERELSERKLTTSRELEVAESLLAEQVALHQAARQRLTAAGGAARHFGVLQLVAPMAGTVVERTLLVGQSVAPDTITFRIADLDHLWIELEVFERHATDVRAGDVVEIEPITAGAASLTGRVSHVGEVVHPETRTIDVRVEVDNRTRALRPGQAVTARIRTTRRAIRATTVPLSAVTWVDGRPTVFVVEGEHAATPRRVELGPDDGARVEVRGELQPGAQVVSKGVFALKSELYR